MTQRKCKIGDVVYLRSGGPSMTVCRLTHDHSGNPSVETTWLTTSGLLYTGSFDEGWLEIIADPIKRMA
jgi:uncharacterized protein YodC (DUF2158 family)